MNNSLRFRTALLSIMIAMAHILASTSGHASRTHEYLNEDKSKGKGLQPRQHIRIDPDIRLDPAEVLPPEIFLHCLSFLSGLDFFNTLSVSQKWRLLALDNSLYLRLENSYKLFQTQSLGNLVYRASRTNNFMGIIIPIFNNYSKLPNPIRLFDQSIKDNKVFFVNPSYKHTESEWHEALKEWEPYAKMLDVAVSLKTPIKKKGTSFKNVALFNESLASRCPITIYKCFFGEKCLNYFMCSYQQCALKMAAASPDEREYYHEKKNDVFDLMVTAKKALGENYFEIATYTPHAARKIFYYQKAQENLEWSLIAMKASNYKPPRSLTDKIGICFNQMGLLFGLQAEDCQPGITRIDFLEKSLENYRQAMPYFPRSLYKRYNDIQAHLLKSLAEQCKDTAIAIIDSKTQSDTREPIFHLQKAIQYYTEFYQKFDTDDPRQYSLYTGLHYTLGILYKKQVEDVKTLREKIIALHHAESSFNQSVKFEGYIPHKTYVARILSIYKMRSLLYYKYAHQHQSIGHKVHYLERALDTCTKILPHPGHYSMVKMKYFIGLIKKDIQRIVHDQKSFSPGQKRKKDIMPSNRRKKKRRVVPTRPKSAQS